MEHGTLWGHGAYLGPDYTTEYLHRQAEIGRDVLAQAPYGRAFKDLGEGQALEIGALLASQTKQNRYDPGADTLRFTDVEAAANLLATLAGRPRQPFRYRDKGSMATLGRGRAVARVGGLSFTGYPAWLAWLFIHLMLLVDFRSRVFVFFEWLWAYLTTQPRARLIIGRRNPTERPGSPSR